SVKSTTSPTSASARPGAFGLPSTATTRAPSCCKRSIPRRWLRPAPTKRIVLTRASLIARVERVVHEADDRLDLRGVPARHAEREPVQHHAREAAEVRGVDVVAKLAVRLRLAEPRGDALAVVPGPLHLLDEARVVPEPPLDLEEHPEPFRALVRHRAERVVDPALDDQADVAVVLLDRERDEEVELRGEVVEDRPAREADLRLEPGDRRAFVAEARERAAGAVEDLVPARLQMLLAHLRHPRTLQNRTDVLLSRRAPEPLPRRPLQRGDRLAHRLGDDRARAAVVRARDDGLDRADGLGARRANGAARPLRDPVRSADRAARREAGDARLRRRPRAAAARDPAPLLERPP